MMKDLPFVMFMLTDVGQILQLVVIVSLPIVIVASVGILIYLKRYNRR